MGFRNIDDIGVAIPNQLYGRKRVIPTEIHPSDLWPMGWKFTMLDGQRVFGNSKSAACIGAQLIWTPGYLLSPAPPVGVVERAKKKLRAAEDGPSHCRQCWSRNCGDIAYNRRSGYSGLASD